MNQMVELLKGEHDMLDKQVIAGFVSGNIPLFARYRALSAIFGMGRRLHVKKSEIKSIETLDDLLATAKAAYNHEAMDLFKEQNVQRQAVIAHLEHIINLIERINEIPVAA
jgi:hypothetical protein